MFNKLNNWLSSAGAVRLAMVGYAILPPAAYVYGGVIFPWYLWPSAVVAFALVSGMVVESRWKCIRLKSVIAMFAVLLLGLSAIRFAATANAGVQESIYRAGVGRFIASIAHTGDTLFLEPAGYIPFLPA
jgi:hypothetical protein